MREFVPATAELSEARQLLIGAYFTMEYAVESAALFNPSIVPHGTEPCYRGKHAFRNESAGHG